MLSDQAIYDRMKTGWKGGKPETACGAGSMLMHTKNARKWLPEKVRELGVRSVCDAGAGDLRWIRRMEWDVDYRAFDLIPMSDDVTKIDISKEALPECDLILCRLVLNHLDAPRIESALWLFAKSAGYLVATQYNAEEADAEAREFQRLDLRKWLGHPLDIIEDGNDPKCRLALWSI